MPERAVPTFVAVSAIAPPAGGRVAARSLWVAVLAVASAVLAVAVVLVPDPSGHGTHTQLGLPPCGFLLSTGLPCPGCGLTTSFAHMARAELTAALTANAFGVVLFVLTALSVPVAAMGLWRAANPVDLLLRLHMEKVLLATSVFGALVWALRLWARVG